MDRAKQREIASKGGKAAHQKGTAHEWTSEEARDAGRKGGIASHQRRREQTGTQPPERGTAEDRAVGWERNDNDRGTSERQNYGGEFSSDRSGPAEPMTSEPNE